MFDGGYAKAERISDTTYGYTLFFYNQDHLGNIREVVNTSGNLQQKTNYYPFGAPYADPDMVVNASLQPYKYNGKELDTMHGLNTYDYGARQYDPITGRWDRVDPLAEKYYPFTPYSYCAGDPVNRFDPDGKKIYIPQKSQSSVLKMINTYSKTQYTVDKHGFMCVDGQASKNEKGSAHYSERIDAIIAQDKKKLTISISDTYTTPDGKIKDIEKDYGGGLTNTTNKADVKTVVTGKDHIVHDTNGDEVKKSGGEVLIHEIVGHAAPAIVGSETGNTVENENIVRKELNLQEREKEVNHDE